jgi:hypothetical protein
VNVIIELGLLPWREGRARGSLDDDEDDDHEEFTDIVGVVRKR